jgi:hypothetical protein
MLVKTWSNGVLFRRGTIDAGCGECADLARLAAGDEGAAYTVEAPSDPSAIAAVADATR